MIVIGAYPRSFAKHPFESDFTALASFLEREVDVTVGLHLLPFWRSSGDGGFALTSWSDVDPNYGTPEDLRRLMGHRKVMLDGIYNHVSPRHPLVQKFFHDPASYSFLVHALRQDSPPPAPMAPRGGSVYRRHDLADGIWQLWQTFGEQSIDLNLNSPEVLAEVARSLDLLKTLGAWAVRLDALPYYGKQGTKTLLHNPDGVHSANRIAQMVADRKMKPVLQIDCDDDLRRYNDLAETQPAAIDFSYDTYFLLALFRQDPKILGEHLIRIRNNTAMEVHRPLRTHDGVLLRSGNQTTQHVIAVVKEFKSRGFQVRYTNGTPYESNNSLPALLGIEESESVYYDKVMLGLIASVLTSDVTYVYLHSLLGDLPEETDEFGEDPRTLQRRTMIWDLLDIGPWSRADRFKEHFAVLAATSATSPPSPRSSSYKLRTEGSILIIENSSLLLGAALNFGGAESACNTYIDEIVSNRQRSGIIPPYGYVMYKIR